MGAADFRVGGRLLATLASQAQGYGNLMMTPEPQADFVRELPEVFLPIRGGWGRMGRTRTCLHKRARMCWPVLCAWHGGSGWKRTQRRRRRRELLPRS